MRNVIIANEGEWEKHVEESEGIRNLKSPIETMLQKKMTWGDIASLDIMKRF